MSDIEKLKGKLTEAFTNAVDDHALKFGIAGSVLSTLGFQLIGGAFVVISGIGIARRIVNDKPVWCDPKPRP